MASSYKISSLPSLLSCRKTNGVKRRRWRSQEATPPRVLVHFYDSLPLVLSCDASPYRMGAMLSHNAEWRWAPSFGRVWDTYRDGKEVRTAGKGSAGNRLRCSKIPPIPLWTEIRATDGPQATGSYFQSRQANFSNGLRLNTKMGPDVRSTPVHNQVPEGHWKLYRRCSEPTILTRDEYWATQASQSGLHQGVLGYFNGDEQPNLQVDRGVSVCEGQALDAIRIAKGNS